jgi:endonuclease/exonuclease/phosphatase family metal-dependent hydrolase
MSYNILNFPNGNISGRVDTLENIVDYYQPHLLMVQELQNEAGLTDITDMMDNLGYGDFENAPFVAQQSAPGNPYKLQQAIIFDRNTMRLHSQDQIITSVRDVNYYKMYLNDTGLQTGSDTTFFHVFVTHLKSSTGSDNELARAQMVQAFQNFTSTNLTNDDLAIIAGDFNIYSNTEDAYALLTNPAAGITMNDPFDSFGNWTGSSFSHKEILTQSTRQSQYAGDGAGGGIDDRFDFILFSNGMMTNSSAITYVPDSYKSLGNNGTCYNNSITSCSGGNEVPNDVLESIYFMSDHIPQVCELAVNLDLNVASIQLGENSTAFRKGNIINNELELIVRNQKAGCTYVHIYNLSGQLVAQRQLNNGTSPLYFSFSNEQIGLGMFIVKVIYADLNISTHRFLVNNK